MNAARSLTIYAGVGMLALTFSLWHALLSQEKAGILRTTETEAKSLERAIEVRFETQAQALLRMAKRWEARGGTSLREWQYDAQSYVTDMPENQAVEWVDSSYHVRWIVPFVGNEAAENLDLSFNERRRGAMDRARDQRQPITVTRVVELVQGGKGFHVFTPVFPNNTFDGFMLGVYHLGRFVEPILVEPIAEGWSIAIFDGDELIFGSENSDPSLQEEWGAETKVDLRGVTWGLKVWPGTAVISDTRNPLPEIVLVAGLLVSILMSLTIQFAITARFRAKEVTEESRQRARAESLMREVVEASHFGIIVVNSFGKISLINGETERLFGYSDGELIGQPVEALVPEALRRQHADYRGNYVSSSPKKHWMGMGRELKGLRKDGTVFDAEIALSPIESVDGKVVLASVADITDRHRAEKALRESEGRLNAYLDHATPLMFLKDTEGRYIRINKSFEKSFGVTTDDVQGKTDYDFFPKETADAFRDNDRIVLESGTAIEFEEKAQHDDGVHTTLTVKFPLFGPDGDPYAVGGISTDITERKRLEGAAEELAEKLTSSNAELETINVELKKATASSMISPI